MHEEGLAHHDIDQDTEDTLDFLLGLDRDEDDEDDPINNTGEPMDIAIRFLKGFPAEYPGNCKVCGRYIQPGEEVNYNRNLGGIVCPRDCGRNYIV